MGGCGCGRRVGKKDGTIWFVEPELFENFNGVFRRSEKLLIGYLFTDFCFLFVLHLAPGQSANGAGPFVPFTKKGDLGNVRPH